jgi:hypothetical protein
MSAGRFVRIGLRSVWVNARRFRRVNADNGMVRRFRRVNADKVIVVGEIFGFFVAVTSR